MLIAILLNLHCIFYTKCYFFCGHKGTKTDQKSSSVKQKRGLAVKNNHSGRVKRIATATLKKFFFTLNSNVSHTIKLCLNTLKRQSLQRERFYHNAYPILFFTKKHALMHAHCARDNINKLKRTKATKSR